MATTQKPYMLRGVLSRVVAAVGELGVRLHTLVTTKQRALFHKTVSHQTSLPELRHLIRISNETPEGDW